MAARQGRGAGHWRAGPPGALGAAFSFVQVLREVNPAEIAQQLRTPVRILVTASELATATRLAEALFGADGLQSWSVAVAPLSNGAPDDRPDLVLLAVDPTEAPLDLLATYRRGPANDDIPILLVKLGGAPRDAERPSLPPGVALVAAPSGESVELARAVPPAIAGLVPELAPALGRRFPAFRAAVASRLIRDVARVNAQFALASSLPANVPLIGGLISGAADTLVLTKNQAVLVYKLAGLYGRDLGERAPLAIEIAPVIGGAFFWRSLARALVGLLPTLVGGLPKMAIAYVGTYTVGEMAAYYYRTGHRPSPELIARFQTEGSRLASEFVSRLRT